MARENYISIFKAFLNSILFMMIGGYIGVTLIPPSIMGMLNIAFFIAIFFSAMSRRSGFINSKKSLYIYASILGILTGSTYMYYFANLGSTLFLSCVLGVFLIFFINYNIAKNSRESNIFNLAPMINGGIIGLIVLEFINMFFFKFGGFDLFISTIAILIYSVYSIFIMKTIEVSCSRYKLSEGEVASLAFSIFISFINLLLDMLRIVSILNRD